MKIVGCDLYTRYQQIAMLDEETGELTERRLEHGTGEVQSFYSELGDQSGWASKRRVYPLVRAPAGGIGPRVVDRRRGQVARASELGH